MKKRQGKLRETEEIHQNSNGTLFSNNLDEGDE